METDFNAASPRLPQTSRERMLRQFEQWLDRALTAEAPPEGLTAELLTALDNGEPLPSLEEQCDLYSLWAAMTALTQEVKLQGRAFKQLNETLAQTREILLPAQAPDSSAPSPLAGESAPPEPGNGCGIGKREIELLIDLRDRLARGASSVETAAAELEASSRRRWARWFSGRSVRHMKETLAALRQGYVLTQDGLDQALQEYNLSPILCEGQCFDPRRMAAVEIEETDELPEGTVVSVYRAGYEWEGEVYRPAQVKVARPRRSNSR